MGNNIDNNSNFYSLNMQLESHWVAILVHEKNSSKTQLQNTPKNWDKSQWITILPRNDVS